ncbi:hypothetical protein FGO68_gene2166 [Halteria grandinella]|uniref:Uncharacterized protein n=1 Tax=Halteria grandinella TaxID=5974 RepID=A0A8J8SV77_HALGN|nr:hypothetical protein FGO68_gene2166 [Halteria grandinella]
MLKRTVERLELMEIEGRFDITRQGLLLPPEERPRNDKTFQFNMGNLEGIEEYKDLHALTKLLYCLPFELNQHAPMLQLQLTEHFEVSFLSPPDSLWYRMHLDSGFGRTESDFDTGIKITCIYIVSSQNESLTVSLKNGDNMEEMRVKSNTLVVLKSRRVAYDIRLKNPEKTGKVFMMSVKISGPVDHSKRI